MAVWDSVLVNDELDLLELRLRLLADHVDHFVVVEADRTFRGVPKPLHVSENLSRFAPWRDKLHLVVAKLSEDPAPWPGVVVPHSATAKELSFARASGQAWSREHEQELAQLEPLACAAPDDVILLGDVDELPRPSAISWLTREPRGAVRLTMRQAIYRANWEWSETWFDGTLALQAKELHSHPMAQVMCGLPSPDLTGYREDELSNAGWHFTSLGSAEDVRRKLDSYSHIEHGVHAGSSVELMRVAQQLRVHHLGLGRLETLSENRLDDLQSLLLEIRPDLFDFSTPPPSWRSDAHSFAATLDKQGRLPSRLQASWRTATLPAPVALVLAGLERARVARRSRRPDPWAWKRGRTIDALGGAS